MLIAQKLKSGSHIRVIAPSRSFKLISEECRSIAKARFEEMGISVSYAKNADEFDQFASSAISSRLEDLHQAFADKSVDAIFTAIGGFNSNELLPYIDYNLIKNNPKIICGFSDITALCNAITAQTGLVTYSGPHFSSFGMLKGLDYTLEYFKKCLFQNAPFNLKPASTWSDDAWYLDQENRNFVKNDDYWVINSGQAKGTIVGGNLGLLDELKGTPYFPNINNSILFLEHCADHDVATFNRNLTALTQHPDFVNVKGLLLGRFEPDNKMSKELLTTIIQSKKILNNIPIIANVDFGHTTPIITFPIGGTAMIDGDNINISSC